MKTVVMTVIAVLVIWSMFRRAEVDDVDPGVSEHPDRSGAVPAPLPGRSR